MPAKRTGEKKIEEVIKWKDRKKGVQAIQSFKTNTATNICHCSQYHSIFCITTNVVKVLFFNPTSFTSVRSFSVSFTKADA